ncbi:hypothetical protein SAMN03080594_102333 [Arenibacter palladensis]|uniref:Uncharacterized protein n=1 Tax=Arenibacter palladensis TaxID=237373 RepID=A0A1M4Y727_9FLAO|nr:hypothetical protein SAMN03080594_102333 [Arenibacter palladensis]
MGIFGKRFCSINGNNGSYNKYRIHNGIKVGQITYNLILVPDHILVFSNIMDFPYIATKSPLIFWDEFTIFKFRIVPF